MEKVYGINPIKVLLHQAETRLIKLYISSSRSDSKVQEIINVARKKNIPVEIRQRNKLDELTGNKTHQGIVGILKPYQYTGLEALIKNRNKFSKFDLIIILDSVMDPQNLGSVIRSACCFGANGVIIPVNRASPVTSAVIKASAGSAWQIPVSRVTNLFKTIDFLKKKGFWIFGAETQGGKDLRQVEFNCHAAILLGGEAKGVRPLLRKQCDFLVSIPIVSDFDSFNVAMAAGIIQYEIFSQRNEKIFYKNS